MTEPEQWAVELWAEMYAAVYGCEPTHPAHMYGNAHRILQRAFEERTDQLIPAPSVDDAMVERVARALRRYALGNISNEEMARHIVDHSWEVEAKAATAAISAMQVKP
ncbi:hypothetical protein [Novosphingobium sp. B1]|uniref:hypothetical protein n=1 Tax=Novosphingobium sp. B1 TaxID=1938756 RepID=UPI0009D8D12C|nr:hypothetical protein [Novosphingobium sp. B1]SMC45521.1 hypothetical protein SAMN06272759_1033 [Novosphingobium sp. B1]